MFLRKGQSTLEYALIIAVIVAGLLLMQMYIKRGYAGRIKSSTDDMGEQFDPNAYNANFQVSQTSNTQQTIQNRVTNTTHNTPQTNTKTGQETIGAWNPTADVYSQ